jgi:2-polyprenyl-6-methoxyphenol hydroxylase-like FAD-dependent oxidoreductase
MAQKPLSILISGAGVAGASLAHMLACHPSFKVKPIITLIERSPIPRTTGQAVDIRGPGVDVIRNIGLEPEIKARHTSETGFAIIDAQGVTIGKFGATGDVKKQSVTSEYEILRGELAGLLLDGVNEAKEKGADVKVVYGDSIESLEDHDHGVEVKFAHGKLEHQTFDAVIAADGSQSKTRTMIFGEPAADQQPAKPSGFYVAFFSIPRVAQDDATYRLCILPGGISLHLRPHRNNKTMGVYLSIMNATKAPWPEIDDVIRDGVAAQKAYMRKRFEGVGWQSERFLTGMDASDDFYMTHWCQVITPQWTKGRCAILGDTAYATMGIGTSLAMTGAYLIAGELSKIASSTDVPTALQRYEDILRPYVAKHVRMLPGFPQLFSPQTAWGVGVLRTTVKVLTTLRIPSLAMRFSGGEEKDGLVLEDYGWKEAQTAEVAEVKNLA